MSKKKPAPKKLECCHLSCNIPKSTFDKLVKFSISGGRIGNRSKAVAELIELALSK